MTLQFVNVPQPPLNAVARRLRRREMTIHSYLEQVLARISALDAELGAFSFVDHGTTKRTALALDGTLGAGIDLGPLMGIPIAVKDLFAVTGMPMTLGSKLDVSDILPRQGPLVSALRRAGAIVPGKTAMTEFALGTVNLTHRSPWNPRDTQRHRTPGGSSGGSAAAVAAGLCPAALGSDTGGSVRQPAACCGVVGYKASHRFWSKEGVFPLAPTFDSIGVFAQTVADLRYLYEALTTRHGSARHSVSGMRLGKPIEHYFDNLQPEVEQGFAWVEEVLLRAGAEIVPIHISEAAEIDAVFAKMIPVEFLATIGPDRFLSGEGIIDPVAFARARAGLEVTATEYVNLDRRHVELASAVDQRMAGFDGWIMPTMPVLPIELERIVDVNAASAWNILATQNTRPGNLFQQCGISLPIYPPRCALPIGLQVMGRNGRDAELIAVAAALEDLFERYRDI